MALFGALLCISGAQAISFWPWACGHVLPLMGGLGSRASEQEWDPCFSIAAFLGSGLSAGVLGTRGLRQEPGVGGGWDSWGLAAQLSRGGLRLSFPGFRFPSLEARGRRTRFPARHPALPLVLGVMARGHDVID